MNETQIMQNNYYNEGISLWQLLRIIKQHFLLIIVTTILIGGATFGVSKYALTPKYTSSAQILVNQKDATANGQAYTNQQADIQMINTYKGLITNYQILSEVSKKLANPTSGTVAYHLSYKKLKKMVSVQTSQNSQLFEVKVKANDAQEASTVANTVTDVFQKRIKGIMGFRNTKVTSRAIPQSKPSFPNVSLFTIGGILVGFFLGTVIAVIKETDPSKK